MADDKKSLEEIMQRISEMQQREKGRKLPDEQIRIFVDQELKGPGKADPDSETAKYLGNLLAHNPRVKQELKKELPASQAARKEKMRLLRREAERKGADKLKADFLGRKKRAAQRELEKIAQEKRRAAGQEALDRSARSTPSAGRNHYFARPVNQQALGTYSDRHRPIPFTQNIPSVPIEHRTKSGMLRGAEFEPIGEPNGKVVLFFSGSGGPAAQFVQPVLEPYLLMGAKVVTLDYRGFGNSETLDKNGRKIGTPLGEKSLYEDGREMLDYVTKTMGVHPEDVILHGYSMGGPVASKVAADYAQEQQRLALDEGRKVAHKLGGLVMQSPTRSMYHSAYEASKKKWYMGFGGWMLGGGYNSKAHMQRLHKYDPEMPVHYVSGSADADKEMAQMVIEARQLPPELAGRLQDAYDEAFDQKRLRRANMSEEDRRREDAAFAEVAEIEAEDDLNDGLDINETQIHNDPRARFANATTYRGLGAHLGPNLSYEDPNLRSLVEGRRAPDPAAQAEQGPQAQV